MAAFCRCRLSRHSILRSPWGGGAESTPLRVVALVSFPKSALLPRVLYLPHASGEMVLSVFTGRGEGKLHLGGGFPRVAHEQSLSQDVVPTLGCCSESRYGRGWFS